MDALQIARRPQGEHRDRHQCDPANEILRATDPFRHDRPDRRVARRITHLSLSPRRAYRPFCLDGVGAAPTDLPTDFRQITPAKPRQPPASNSHSGLSRVAKASAAATAVTRTPTQVRSAANAQIRPPAPINPLESGTRAACIIA